MKEVIHRRPRKGNEQLRIEAKGCNIDVVIGRDQQSAETFIWIHCLGRHKVKSGAGPLKNSIALKVVRE